MTEEKAIDIKRIKPIGAKLLVRKCVQKQPDYIILPDQAKEQTSFCEILAVGEKCKFFGKQDIGKMVELPEYADGMHALVEGSSEYWIVVERILDPIVYDD